LPIKGTLRDTTDRPLEGATVMLLDGKDTSLVSFSRSQSTGTFEFKNIAAASYFLKATFMGLQPLNQLITPSGGGYWIWANSDGCRSERPQRSGY
jgi:hypothetical protein